MITANGYTNTTEQLKQGHIGTIEHRKTSDMLFFSYLCKTNVVRRIAFFCHKYRIISDDEKATMESINLLRSVKITLKNALDLIGVIPEERM